MNSIERLIQLLQPDIVVGGPATQLPAEVLIRRGIRGVILDIDNTIVSAAEPDASPEVKAWLVQMGNHFPIWLVSNNWNTRRIRRIAADTDLPYINRAIKPSRRALRRAIAAMDLPPEGVAIVGDRIFTDVVGGNRLGLLTVFVDPLCSRRRPRCSFERTFSLLWGINLKKTL
ncbi:YqeG family HAD IIIA-type phosphatase [Synechococcus sp. PCC 7336]|uniref:YqeG family HAD IIIA-type phosphatase n=1 Tax=Synechococcus sp. PCC 7336 TaxID=195250 RepID=UPI00037F1415|nr:YqeG family HAD IIIA-type phosphatase [Synechococcus sp. PCC 7336]